MYEKGNSLNEKEMIKSNAKIIVFGQETQQKAIFLLTL